MREPGVGLGDAGGFVLAGGRSSRMGTDKALTDFCGRPLVVHTLDLLRRAGLPAVIAGARSDLAAYGPVLEDAEQDRGPLSGICNALRRTGFEYAVFVSVDMPLLPHSLIAFLLAHAQTTGRLVTLCSVSGFSQTFPAVLRRRALPALENELRSGAGGCFAAFRDAASGAREEMSVVPVEPLVQCRQISHPDGLPPFRWFLNVNTPGDLERASRIASHRVI